ncbi:MAG: MBL fold metallo-hydrolase, partial [Lachnospiraceae bacterium]|nr:MBL fold metallo-hydrolase [Lachnospiraceae bacterium]
DRDGLMEWISAFKNKPIKVFVVHGDDLNATALTNRLKDEKGLDASAPYSGAVYDLIAQEFITEAAPRPVKKKVIVSNVFNRLLAAGERLMSVIRKNSGLANKDMARFADQINALSDKYDRKD